MVRLLLVLLSIQLVGCAGKGVNEQITAKITDYGLYTVESSRAVKLESSPSGTRQISKGAKFYEQTTEIPLETGIRFGFMYVLENCQPGQSYSIVRKYAYPPMKGKTKASVKVKNKCGKNAWVGWSLEHEYELVEGDFTFQVTSAGRVLAEKTFTTVKP